MSEVVTSIGLNLYFERFLNPHRTSPPDFDIDFSWTDRDEVMDYVFKRYGKDYVALLGLVSTFKHDAIIQQLGKVFGLPPDEIKTLQRSGKPTGQIQKLILQYGKLLYGFPNIMSLHPCGMLVSEKPITNYAALFMPPKGFQTTQMDMFSAEDIGLNKFDVLSQRGLGHIKECINIIRQNRGIAVNIHDIAAFKKDDRIKAMIRNANTIGCFYIESPAMRGLLKKLRCDDYLTLVAASSIIRPGVAESGMMREYISRYHNRGSIKYPHPLFEEHLSETFGVMVYQEDVIKIAHYFAGLDLGEADILRRAMSGKYRSMNEFNMIRQRFMDSCATIGHSKELAEEVWRQMQSFAGYSFNKAHSASFAVESYQSLYLKTYYPKEFMVAVINNFGGFYSRELYFLELLKWGGNIHPPCINESDLYTNINGDTVYVGFIHIKGLQEKLVDKILEDRKARGLYLHLQEFIERVNPGLEQLNTLISIGAFAFTGKSRKRLLWETREQVFNGRYPHKDHRGNFVDGLNFLNAISEEILYKGKVYRQAALNKRYLFLSSGFYEWRHVFPKNKRTGEPRKTAVKYSYRIMLKDREYFWLAGIWQQWDDASTGEVVNTASIVTTQANEVMAEIHNVKKRQPTMLSDDLAYEWVFGNLSEQDIQQIASWQMPYEELNYCTLAKDFLNSNDPLKKYYYHDFPPLDVPGGDLNEQQEGQLQLF